MGDKGLLFIIVMLILAVSFFWIPNPELTGFTITEATISPITLELETTKIAVNSPIKGNISLLLSEDLNPAEPITLTLDSQTYTYTIEELLKRANYSLEYETAQFNATNEALEKSLAFSNAGSQFLGLKLPRYAEVSDVSFSLEASAINGEYPQAVSMDFGNEGTIDWYYLGSFIEYNATQIKSEDLDSTKEGTGYIEGDTYYCEFISLPRTKHLTISANYTKIASKGDLQAAALSVPTNNPKIGWSGGADSCDLPESGTANSCSLELDFTIEGKYLICIFASGDYEEGELLYEIPLDNSQETDTTYTCPTAEGSVCDETSLSNFFIYVQTGKYDNALLGKIPLEEWETFSSAILTGIKYYVGSSPYNGLCKTTTCSIPINITTENTGNLTFKDLSIVYDYNEITQTSSTWYDVELPQADIIAIEEQVLEDGITIEIPLELLEITEENTGEYILEAFFLEGTASAAISIQEASDILDATTLIQTAEAKLNDFLDKNSEEYQVLTMLDKTQALEQTLEDLGSYKNQIGFTEDTLLVEEIEKTLNDIPWEITSTLINAKSIKIESPDIPSTLGEENDILNMQTAISVEGSLKTITIKDYNEETTTFILIKKEITANENIEEAALYEIFPIEFSKILSTSRPKSSSGNQAEYTFSLDTGETETFYYLTTEAVSVNDFLSIIVLSETKKEEPPYICGDLLCDENYEDTNSCPEDCKEELNMYYIIIPAVLIIILALLFLFRKKLFKKDKDPKIH